MHYPLRYRARQRCSERFARIKCSLLAAAGLSCVAWQLWLVGLSAAKGSAVLASPTFSLMLAGPGSEDDCRADL